MSYQEGEVGREIWNNIEPNNYNLASRSLAPIPTNCTHITGMMLYGFRGGSLLNELFAIFELPHDYKVKTAIRPHIHWCADTTEIANVKWQMSYSIGDDNTPFTAEKTLTAIQSTNGADNYLSKEFAPIISDSVLNGGAIIMVRLFRDVSNPDDTYSGIAKLFSFGIHYQSKGSGSSGVFVT